MWATSSNISRFYVQASKRIKSQGVFHLQPVLKGLFEPAFRQSMPRLRMIMWDLWRMRGFSRTVRILFSISHMNLRIKVVSRLSLLVTLETVFRCCFYYIHMNDRIHSSSLLKHVLFADDNSVLHTSDNVNTLISITNIEVRRICVCFEVWSVKVYC